MRDRVDVLVVDDDGGAAQSFCRLIESKTRLHAVSVSTPKDAMAVVGSYFPRVVVLDQVMPDMRGTDLFQLVTRMLPNTKAILLTAQPDDGAISDAVNIGFSRFIHKADVAQLPEAVMTLFAESLAEESEHYSLEESSTIARRKRCGQVVSSPRGSARFIRSGRSTPCARRGLGALPDCECWSDSKDE